MTRVFALLSLCMVIFGVTTPLSRCADELEKTQTHLSEAVLHADGSASPVEASCGEAHFCSLGNCPIIHSSLSLDLTSRLIGVETVGLDPPSFEVDVDSPKRPPRA